MGNRNGMIQEEPHAPTPSLPAVMTPAVANQGWVRIWEESKDK